MSFKLHYQSYIERSGFRHDVEQLQAVDALHRLADDVLKRHSESGLLNSLRRGFSTKYVKGCYIWGGVGRGKTWLMDMFYNSLSISNKKRWHFHQFMQRVHSQLNSVDNHRDPLRIIAKRFAQKYRVICLDEFHVSDITDAMLLHGLLKELYNHSVVVVFTSNHRPHSLYKNGLQRERFVPAIELIIKHSVVIKLKGDLDYRRVDAVNGSKYFYLCADKIEKTCDKQMLSHFRATIQSGENIRERAEININNRGISTKYLTGSQVWFEFDILCGEGRATVDYIEIANQFSSVFVSNVPNMDDSFDDMAKRFIHFIDEMYDRRRMVAISALDHAEHLYSGKRFQAEFKRTVSRLTEMRSVKYANG